MTTTIEIQSLIKPPLRWLPEPKEFTDEFLETKSRGPSGPILSDLRSGPDSVLQEAIRILGRCLPPEEQSGSETGLVVGYVQSGKTLSFETVIALARDNGFGIAIVLAGTKNNLRDQSEERLKKDLGIESGGDQWCHFSNPTNAQRAQIETKVSAWQKKHSKKSILITVLKHGSHLDKLTRLLKSISLERVPTLVIDDESDQASLNTHASRIRKNLTPITTMSTTYERILALRNVLPHHSYLQYTATPQANLLLAHSDLLNPSFTELVTPGETYTGGQTFFNGQNELIEVIPIGDVPSSRSQLTGPPKSLIKALRFFLLAAAQHSLTRKTGFMARDQNRSMMVHPDIKTASHHQYIRWIERAFRAIKRQIESGNLNCQKTIETLFQAEYDSLAKTFPEIRPLSDLLEAMTSDVLDEVNWVEVNGTPDAEKKVNWNSARYWILIGGSKLDRGYTVEGLCVTYMPRPLGGSPAADTLQQRARFFGYKKSYLGLCRVFIQESVRSAFVEYVNHEEFVRKALAEHRGQPLRQWRRDFILTQMLKPTRPNVVGLDLRRVLIEEWIVPSTLHRDEDAVSKNRFLLDQAERLWSNTYSRVNASIIPELTPSSGISPNDIIQDIPLKIIIDDFLLKIEVKDPSDAELHSATLIALSNILANDPLLTVDVFLMNKLKAGYRSRAARGALPARDRNAPINQYFSQSANTINDKSFRSKGRISLQLRRFDLGWHPRDQASSDINNVTWYALFVPKSMSRDLVIEERSK